MLPPKVRQIDGEAVNLLQLASCCHLGAKVLHCDLVDSVTVKHWILKETAAFFRPDFTTTTTQRLLMEAEKLFRAYTQFISAAGPVLPEYKRWQNIGGL